MMDQGRRKKDTSIFQLDLSEGVQGMDIVGLHYGKAFIWLHIILKTKKTSTSTLRNTSPFGFLCELSLIMICVLSIWTFKTYITTRYNRDAAPSGIVAVM